MNGLDVTQQAGSLQTGRLALDIVVGMNLDVLAGRFQENMIDLHVVTDGIAGSTCIAYLNQTSNNFRDDICVVNKLVLRVDF